jgi:hypothetical protein
VTPEAIDPAEQELEDKVDLVVKAQVARGLEEGMGAMMIYAQRLSDNPFMRATVWELVSFQSVVG